MNQVQKGCARDRRIVALVEEWGCLTAEQVAVLAFAGRNAQRLARHRLLRLTDKGFLARFRPAHDLGYCYYIGKRPGRLEHRVAVNWVRLWLTHHLSSWEVAERWEYEPDYGTLRPDGLFAARNTARGSLRLWFVELDRAAGGNRFDKVAKYTALYESGRYLGAWWCADAERFPAVLVVTDAPSRATGIRNSVDRENRAGLRFETRLLEDVRKEMLRC